MKMRTRWAALAIAGIGMVPVIASAAEVAGKWVVEISSTTALEPSYLRVTLEQTGDTLSGTWGSDTAKGTVKGTAVTISLTDAEGRDAGTVTGKVTGDSGEGAGTMAGQGRRGGAAAAGARAPMLQAINWKLTRELVAPPPGRQVTYEPKEFQAYYSAANKPGIHIFPGDIVHTWAPDSGGTDKTLKRVALGGDANIGPIYVEGALPGDTLVVHLIRSRRTGLPRGRAAGFSSTPSLRLITWPRNMTRDSTASGRFRILTAMRP